MSENTAEHARSRRAGTPWFIFFGLLLVVALIWWRHDTNSGPRGKPSPQVVSVATAARRDMALYLTALGTVTPNNTVTVHSRVDGQLIRIGFTEGQKVKAGQMLAELDPRPFQAALTEARGQLARDQALLANARLDLTRYRALLADNAIPKQQLDTQAALVAQYQGTVTADLGAVDSARLQLEYSRITAPVSGRVGLKQVDLGNIVHASDSNGVVVITEMQPTDVVFSLPEDQLSSILPGIRLNTPMPVEARDRENRRLLARGRLKTADNQVDTSTGTVKLKAVFDNADDALFPNQFVNVRLGTEQRKGALVIPLAALQRGQPGSFVYVVRPDNSIELRVIEPGPSEGDSLIVDKGLQPGERVVIDGVDRLRNGVKVVVAKDNDSAGKGGKAGRGASR
jgi:membrane fusion protein, multidrug efflux system